MDIYIKDIDKDEVRDGFLVTAQRKKVWNVELDLLMYLDGICKKYDLNYYLDAGTLLGAVRHKGFIPWDDDIDIVMLRPEYERLNEIMKTEIKEPYFYQTFYTGGGITISKLRNSNTTGIEKKFWDRDMHQGIFIDIWPFDAAPDGTNRKQRIYDMEFALYMALLNPQFIVENMDKAVELKNNKSMWKKILALPVSERFREYENFCLRNFEDSDRITFLPYLFGQKYDSFYVDDYLEIAYLPFEGLELPAPAGYDRILKNYYGDYSKFVIGGSEHEGMIFSADIPYKEFLAAVNKEFYMGEGTQYL